MPDAYKRQQYLLLDSNRQLLGEGRLPFRTIYDPVALTVTITGPEGPGKPWLVPEQTYHLVLPVASDERDRVEAVSGFRAIDRAPLGAPLEYTFRAGPPTGQTQIDPPVDFCADVMPIFAAKCNGCHGASESAGLILWSEAGIRATALNRIAHGSNTGRHSTTPGADRRVFGIDMPIIAPGDPGSSWLMYKLALAPPPVTDAGPAPNIVCYPPGAAPTTPSPFVYEPGVHTVGPDDYERSVLAQYVPGREMPYPQPPEAYADPAAYLFTPLTFQEREKIRVWIASMSVTEDKMSDCGGCAEPEPPADAGAP